jgi:hypothetical protein
MSSVFVETFSAVSIGTPPRITRFGHQAISGDALPTRHLRRRSDASELLVERLGIDTPASAG